MSAGGGLISRHADINVIFDNYFTNYTRQLRADDKIRFKGVLLNSEDSYNIGDQETTINGYEINCLECKRSPGNISSKTPSNTKFSDLCKTIVNDCIVSTKYILNFMLNPVIVFK